MGPGPNTLSSRGSRLLPRWTQASDTDFSQSRGPSHYFRRATTLSRVFFPAFGSTDPKPRFRRLSAAVGAPTALNPVPGRLQTRGRCFAPRARPPPSKGDYGSPHTGPIGSPAHQIFSGGSAHSRCPAQASRSSPEPGSSRSGPADTSDAAAAVMTAYTKAASSAGRVSRERSAPAPAESQSSVAGTPKIEAGDPPQAPGLPLWPMAGSHAGSVPAAPRPTGSSVCLHPSPAADLCLSVPASTQDYRVLGRVRRSTRRVRPP